MSDFDQTSLRDELEVRVIALLTGELSETEADQLEKILANDAELSAFRDRMAELMGELHDGREELANSKGEPPRQLSEERRAKIFGDSSVLEVRVKQKKVWFRPAFWGVAASIVFVGFLSALLIPAFQKVRYSSVAALSEKQDSGAYYEVPPPAPEPAYEADIRMRSQSAPPAEPPAITVNDPSDLDIPALDIDIATDSSSTYGRSGGGFGGGLSSVRELSVSADESKDAAAKRDQRGSDDFAIDQVETAWLFDMESTIPVDIPQERIEGTPRPIRVPGLEPPATEAPRMVVTEDALRQRKVGNKELESRGALDTFGVDLVPESGGAGYGLGVASRTTPTDKRVLSEQKQRADLYERSASVDPFAAPKASSVSSRSEAGQNQSVAYAGSGPVDAFAAPARKKQREDIGGVTDLKGREMDEHMALNGATSLGDVMEVEEDLGSNLAKVDYFDSYDVGADAITIQPGDSVASVAKVSLTPKPEKLAVEEPFSTFSLNISDVSFKLAQAALANFRVPPKAQIRTEEFVNSFDYGDPVPRPDEPVALSWEIAQHPFEHDRQVVRFSLQTQASGRASGQPLNISLLVDNSGSMQRPDRRAILQNSLQTLEEKLTPQDNLNIILFARQPRLIAEAQTRASQKAAVESALDYRPEGGTNLEAGLRAAYETAERNFLPNGSNRVIVMTDGAANLGNVNAGQLAEYVVEQRKQGIALDAYGIGWDDYNDALLEEITRNGDGRYAFLNSVEEASADFSEKLAGTLRVAASNVKVQIEWNPDRVQRYRQIGYDLHQLKKEDFRDNTVDAAEIGEEESGTALYVLKIDDDPKIIGGLGTLHVRYLDPASGLYKEHSWPLPMPRQIPAARAASPSMRLAMTSAFFGERLAGSPYAGGYGFNDLYKMTSGLPEAFPKQPRVTQMQSMLLQANELYGENK